MNSHTLIPLIATLAYIPLLVIVLLNRPWQARQRFLFLFLIPAVLWSGTDVIFRSNLFMQEQEKLLLVRIVLFCAVWMIIQYRYFLQSFFKSDGARRPFPYIILAVYVGLAALGYVPRDINIIGAGTDDINIHIEYGLWLVAIAAVIAAITSRDLYRLVRKLKISDNVEERNQIIYLLVGLSCLGIFGLLTFRFSAEGLPVGHIGNFLNACILTYAVVQHRLIDVRVIIRQVIIYLVLYGGALGIMMAFVWFALPADYRTELFGRLAVITALAIPVILFAVYRVRDFWQRKVEEAFIGTRSSSRRQLHKFIDKMHPTLGQLGNQLISLLAESLDCRRVCLLLPEPEGGGLNARFTYPPVADNPMSKLKLRSDSPVVAWLEREKGILPIKNLAIFPEFRSIWKDEREETQLAGVMMFVPLVNNGKLVGVVALGERRDAKPYAVEDMDLLESVAAPAAASIENAQIYARAEQKSRIDELTGLFNRRHFEERLKEEVARHSRYGDAFSIFMLDLDNFKTYNDVYGHPAGDILLGQVGKMIRSSVRDADQAFRYGGDEFVVILPQTARDDAEAVAERVRVHIAREMEKKSITVTCSIGLASYPEDGVIPGELVSGSDTALYYAKWTGGNRIYFSSKVTPELLDDRRIRGKRESLGAVYALVSVVESRDPYIYGHSRKVNAYAVALAEAMGLSPDVVSNVSTAALLHDIGKIGIPDEVLNKKEKLSTEDWLAIKAHPRLGANIVCNIPQLIQCSNNILHHHERWDGSGYPDGLKGEQIPIESRILAIADSFEAMSSARPYRPALSRQEVLQELRKGAGNQFDPNLVHVFIDIIEAGLPEKVKAG